ncbi:uncharacterized protein [Apostichopus japonicus]|uniref:uncharacterized protein isoform X2 n=1 Tax=Stichopus japonicus TaxID=307972 RepID=UPI003AB3CFA8
MARVKFLVVISFLGLWQWEHFCEAEYCSGFSDEDGVYQAGFHCPLLTDSTENLYCCGTEVDKFCCDTNSNSFFSGLDPAAIIGTVLAIVVVLLVCVTLCCCCCSCCIWNRRKNNKRGNQVRYNNLDGTVNTTVSTIATPSDTERQLYPPSAPPGVASTSNHPFNPHAPHMPPQPQQMPHPMPQPYPTSPYIGGREPYPPQSSHPPLPSQEAYPCKEEIGYPPQPSSSPSMQAPPPYHDPHHQLGAAAPPNYSEDHQIGFTTASAPPPDSMPYVTKI